MCYRAEAEEDWETEEEDWEDEDIEEDEDW